MVLAVSALPLAPGCARSDHRHATAFDGACLRGKCESDPAFGYELMSRFAQVLIERLQWTRLRLLDVYGTMTVAETAKTWRDGSPARSVSALARRTRETRSR